MSSPVTDTTTDTTDTAVDSRAKRDETFRLMRKSLKEVIKITGYDGLSGDSQEDHFKKVVSSVQALADRVAALEAEKKADADKKRKRLEEETKSRSLGAASVAAAPPPPPCLITDSRTNVRIKTARDLRKGMRSKFPETMEGIEPGITFIGDGSVRYVIVGYDPTRPKFGIWCVAYSILTHYATGILPVHLKSYSIDWVLKQLDPSALKRVQKLRVAKYAAPSNIPPAFTSDGFFIDVDGQLRKCVVYDITKTGEARPIKIRELGTGREWSYPLGLFLDHAISIVDQKRKLAKPVDSAARKRPRFSDSDSDDDE